MTTTAGTNHVQLYKTFPEHVQSHAQIVKDLKQRDEHDKIQDRETVKRGQDKGGGGLPMTQNCRVGWVSHELF